MDGVISLLHICLLFLSQFSSVTNYKNGFKNSLISPGEWTSRIIHLLNDQHMGVVTAAVSLIDALSKKAPDEYKGCVPLAVSRLSRIVTSSYTGASFRVFARMILHVCVCSYVFRPFVVRSLLY